MRSAFAAPAHAATHAADALRALARSRALLALSALLLAFLWGRAISAAYRTSGLFYWLGTDYALYHAQSLALHSGDPAAAYDLDAEDIYYHPVLSRWAGPLGAQARPFQTPYPPLFAWLFTPFTHLEPPVGFALWTGLNLLGAAHLAWRAGQQLPAGRRGFPLLLLLSSFPLVYSLWVGQPQILLASAMAECFLALRRRRDLAAGLWLAGLAIKPQYGLLLGLFLLVKGRLRAVGGAVLGVALVVAGSLAVSDARTVFEVYPHVLRNLGGLRDLDYAPYHMINWRSLVLVLGRRIGDPAAWAAILVLGLATVALAWLHCRGPWAPEASSFPARFTLVLLATLLANFHSHAYGAVVLGVPLAALAAEAELGTGAELLLVAIALVPTLCFTLVRFLSVSWTARVLALLLVILFAEMARARLAVPRPWRPAASAAGRALTRSGIRAGRRAGARARPG